VTDDVEPDARFLERLIARDEHAINALVTEHQGRVLALTTRLLGNPAEAEEITQEVFIQVFKAIDSFRGDSKLSTWIFRIAVNLCKNRYKYLRVRKASEQQELDPETNHNADGRAPMTIVARPDEVVAGREVERIVQRAIAEIDETFRECLILRDVEELSYEEIGDITGLPPGTVKSRIFRARAVLRERVEAALGEKLR
jgi:RNA polymerase sigma-70 factor (ECF subfamily)